VYSQVDLLALLFMLVHSTSIDPFCESLNEIEYVPQMMFWSAKYPDFIWTWQGCFHPGFAAIRCLMEKDAGFDPLGKTQSPSHSDCP